MDMIICISYQVVEHTKQQFYRPYASSGVAIYEYNAFSILSGVWWRLRMLFT